MTNINLSSEKTELTLGIHCDDQTIFCAVMESESTLYAVLLHTSLTTNTLFSLD